jgi:hypothetical protein
VRFIGLPDVSIRPTTAPSISVDTSCFTHALNAGVIGGRLDAGPGEPLVLVAGGAWAAHAVMAQAKNAVAKVFMRRRIIAESRSCGFSRAHWRPWDTLLFVGSRGFVIALAAALAVGGYALACGTTYTDAAPGSGDGGGTTAESGAAQGTDAGGGGDAQSQADGAACMPPACGGAGGRCGSVDACGLTFSCGDCAPPFTCMGGTCQCEGDASCAARGATCGSFDDGCGTQFSCGQCDAGPSYCGQQGGGGFVCGSAPCVPNPQATTCSGKCSSVTNNCGQTVNCGTACNGTSPSQLCASAPGGGTSTCSCPTRTSPLDEFVTNGKHCYDDTPLATQCANGAASPSTIAHLYSAQYPGLVPLYRCHHVAPQNGTYLVTTSSNCELAGTWAGATQIGYCAPANASTCGAVPLYRYTASAGGQGGADDHVLTTSATAPTGYDQSTQVVVCAVWTT